MKMDSYDPDAIAANAVEINLNEAPPQRPAHGKKTVPDYTFKRTNTETIMATKFPPIMWVVPDYLPEGFSVMAGRQKLGKTWLAMDFAVAVATGGAAMGQVSCEAGDVLYIDLENGARRIQSRIETLFPDERNRPDLSRLDWVDEAPKLDQGFIGACEKWRKSVRQPRLIVIDVLQRVKPTGSNARNAYENDYAAFEELQTWAKEKHVAVLALHHTKKGGADDPLEALSGSNGLSACADTTLVLDRDGNGITLYVRGRDVAEIESSLSFDGGIWSILGDATEVRRSDERTRILTALRDATEPMSPNDVTDVTGMKSQNVRKNLSRMVVTGDVTKMGRGRYMHPDNAAAFAENPVIKGFSNVTGEDTPTPGHIGHNVTNLFAKPKTAAQSDNVTDVTPPHERNDGHKPEAPGGPKE